MVDADLKSYFDTIPHDRLMARVAEKIADGRVLDADRKLSQGGHHADVARWTPTAGTPQGAVIVPLLAQHLPGPAGPPDGRRTAPMVRYADDFVILCRTAKTRRRPPWRWCEHVDDGQRPDAASGQDADRATPAAGQGFDFLGYRFEAGHRFARRKSLRRSRTRSGPRRGAAGGTALRGSSRISTGRCGVGLATSSTPHHDFRKLDGFVRRRLRAILRKQDKRPGFGRSPRRPSPLAKCLLRGRRGCSPCTRPMQQARQSR